MPGFSTPTAAGGISKLSELEIDTDKDWLAYLIKNLGAPVDDGDAFRQGDGISKISIDTDKDWAAYLIKNLGAPAADTDAARRVDIKAEPTVLVAASDARDDVKQRCDLLCDGTDDDLTIEDAFGALPAAGGTVKLSEGTFTFGSSLDILKSNVSLIGSGPGTVIEGAIDVTYIIVGDGATALSNIKISNLRIDGTDQTGGHGIYAYGASGSEITEALLSNICIESIYSRAIYGEYLLRSEIRDCEFKNTGDTDIRLYYSSYNSINGCVSYNSAGRGIDAAGLGTNHVAIVGNVIHSSYDDSIRTLSYATVQGNVIYECGSGRGIYVGDEEKYVSVIGNEIYGAYDDAIELGILDYPCEQVSCIGNVMDTIDDYYGIGAYANKSVIIGNTMKNINRHGIRLEGSRNIVKGNYIENPSQVADADQNAINLQGGAKYNIVEGNQIFADATNRPAYGINEATTDDNYNIVTGNRIEGMRTGKYGISGPNTEYDGGHGCNRFCCNMAGCA